MWRLLSSQETFIQCGDFYAVWKLLFQCGDFYSSVGTFFPNPTAKEIAECLQKNLKKKNLKS